MKRLLLIFSCWIFFLPMSGQYISYAEYFFDQDPGFGKAIPFSFASGTNAEIQYTLPVNGIDNGLHHLYTRVRDAGGRWSQTDRFPFFILSLSGQSNSDIQEVEYFFNQDPGFGKALPIVFDIDNPVTITAALPLYGMPEGINALYIRTKDKFNAWSQTSHFTFLVQRLPTGIFPEIQEVEYFFNEDPGPGNGNPVAFEISNDITVAAGLSLDNLSEGVHTLFLRAKDSSGAWGVVSHFNFLVQPLPVQLKSRIEMMEYFIDQDPGFGMGQPIYAEADNDLLIATEIPLEALNEGVHTLYVRGRDDQGRWGMVSHSNFLKVEVLRERNEIIALEYFINEDPGFGRGIPIQQNTPREISQKFFVLEGAQLQPGENRLYVRALDSDKRWGHIYSTQFEVLESGACSPPTNLNATEVTETDAKLGWSSEGETDSWDLIWVKNGQDYTEDGVLQNRTADHPFHASLLTPATLYNFYVRSWCPDGQVSGWAVPGVFHTLPLAVNELTLSSDPPSGGICTGGGSYSWGESITVNAFPNSGFVFSHWSGDTVYLDHSTTASASLVMPGVPVNLTAHFLDVSGAEEHHLKTLRIYPVPANDVLWVECYNTYDDQVFAQLINIQGRIVYQFSLAGKGFHQQRVALETMSPGIYFLRLEGAGINTTRKMLISS